MVKEMEHIENMIYNDELENLKEYMTVHDLKITERLDDEISILELSLRNWDLFEALVIWY